MTIDDNPLHIENRKRIAENLNRSVESVPRVQPAPSESFIRAGIHRPAQPAPKDQGND